MKRSAKSLLAGLLVVMSLAGFAPSLLAQGKGGGGNPPPPPPPPTNVRYWVNWISGPAEATEIVPRDFVVQTDGDGVPILALVVGHYRRSDRNSWSGFVYDMLGSIDPDATYADPDPETPNKPVPNQFWDIEDLVGSTPAGIPWVSPSEPLSTFQTVFRGVNSTGIVAGYVNDASGSRHAVYLRLNQNPLDVTLIPDAISPSTQNYAVDVTEVEDVLIHSWNGSSYVAFVYRLADGSMAPIVNPATGQPFLTSESWPNLSSAQDFVGLQSPGSVVFRHSILTGQTESFPNLISYVPDCNELGDFVSAVRVYTKKNMYKVHATRVGKTGTPWVGTASTQGVAINDQGDVLIEKYPDLGYYSYFHQGLQATIALQDLVINESDPNRWFRDAGGYNYAKMSNRDATNFGWIVTGVSVPQPDGTSRGVLALLIPEILP